MSCSRSILRRIHQSGSWRPSSPVSGLRAGQVVEVAAADRLVDDRLRRSGAIGGGDGASAGAALIAFLLRLRGRLLAALARDLVDDVAQAALGEVVFRHGSSLNTFTACYTRRSMRDLRARGRWPHDRSRGLTKHYGSRTAVDGIDFTVRRGSSPASSARKGPAQVDHDAAHRRTRPTHRRHGHDRWPSLLGGHACSSARGRRLLDAKAVHTGPARGATFARSRRLWHQAPPSG